MEKYFIGTLNNISQVGLSKLTENYELVEDVDKANGIIVRSFKMHDMDFSENLLAIGRAGAGVNNIPLEKCADQGIVVFNAPGANSNAVKELVLAALIMGARNMYEGISWANTLEGDDVSTAVEKGKKNFAGTEISGKTIGIIGLGAIGAKIANSCEALGMNVCGYEAFRPHPCLTADVKMFDDVAEMVKECDFVSIHVPSLPATKGMINKDLIANMKDGVIILNFARPDLVVVDDIKAALEAGKIRKYMTDLANEETIGVPGIVATPHLGASTAEAEENCAVMAAEELMDYLGCGNIRNSVNFPAVSLDCIEGTKRVCVLYKDAEDKAEEIKAFYGDCLVEMASGKRGDYGYVICAVKSGCPNVFEAPYVVRTRVIG